jgi:hypothetical protein
MNNYKRYLKYILMATLSVIIMLFASCKKDKEEAKSDACEIIMFTVDDKNWTKSGTEFTYSYPAETVEGERVPTIVLSDGATVEPPASQAQNFFKPEGVTYTVTAENGVASQKYTAKATRLKYSGCEITLFKVNNAEWFVTNDSLINYVFPTKTEEGNLTPEISLSPGATINPPANQPQNFFKPEGVRYIVTSDDGKATKAYIVKARNKSSEARIISFKVFGKSWNINEETELISYTYTEEIATTDVMTDIVYSPGATISPPGSALQDKLFTAEGVTYTVTAEDGITTKTYTAKGTADVASNKLNEYCTWALSGVAPNLTLTIRGNGYMPHYGPNDTNKSDEPNRPPWEEYQNDIVAVVIEDGVTGIGDFTFQDYDKITSVTIGNTATFIGQEVFERCYSLTSVTIGNSVRTIGWGAFHACNISSITLPASLEIIDSYVFHRCPLNLVICHRSTPPEVVTYTFGDSSGGDHYKSATLRVPASSVSVYRSTEVWTNFGTIEAINN